MVVLFILILASFFARWWSKKGFISQGHYLIALGLLSASFSHSYVMLVISLMIAGLGGGLIEAFLNPLIVDIHPVNSGRYLNFSNAFYPLGVMASAIIFGELLTAGYSWRIIFRLASGSTIIVGFFFNILNFPQSKYENKMSWTLYTDILSTGGFWLFSAAIFLGGGIESALTFWGTSYVKEYFSDIPRAGAIAVMIFAGSMAVGRLFTAYISTRFSLKIIMMGSTIMGAGIGLLLPLASGLIEFYALISLAGIAAACFWPTILAEAKSCLKVDTTILFILLASVGVIGFGITPLVMGIIGDFSNLKTSFILIPIFFAVLFFILILEKRYAAKIAVTAD